MQISGYIADWDRLKLHLQIHRKEWLPTNDDWFYSDSFTRFDDSYSLNCRIGNTFVEIQDRMPKEESERFGTFLVTFCPRLFSFGDFDHPVDLDHEITPDWFFATASPDEVRRRLALLDGLHLPKIMRLFLDRLEQDRYEYPELAVIEAGEVIRFFFMWAAALGQAASKGWGLVVSLD